MTAALTTAARQQERPPQRLTLTFTNNHPCHRYQRVEGWLVCIHQMLIRPDQVAAREADARARLVAPGGECG